MQTIKIPIRISNEGLINIPNEYIKILPKEKPLTVIYEIPDSNSSQRTDWKEFATKAFFDGYDESDGIYDSL